MEKVSIIVPAYNCEKTIKKCINSIINQTYPNIEVIVINDGSTDNTKEYIEEMALNDGKVKVYNKANEGVSASRNYGIDVSKGEFIMFLDADDWIDETTVEKLVYTIKKYNVDMVRYNYYVVNEEEKKCGRLYELANKRMKINDENFQSIARHLFLNYKSFPCLVMLLLIRKERIIQFDKSLFMMEDVYFYQKILYNNSSIYFLDEPLYYYCYNEDSATNSKEKYLDNIYGILDTNRKMTELFIKKQYPKNNITKLNSNHLKIISNYIYMYYVNNGGKKTKMSLNELYKNNQFIKMIEKVDLEYIPLRNKFLIISLKMRSKNIFCLLLKAIQIAKEKREDVSSSSKKNEK